MPWPRSHFANVYIAIMVAKDTQKGGRIFAMASVLLCLVSRTGRPGEWQRCLDILNRQVRSHEQKEKSFISINAIAKSQRKLGIVVAGGLNTATGFICIALHCICEAKLQQDRTCPNMSKRAATRGSGILGCCAARLFRLTGDSRTTSFFSSSIVRTLSSSVKSPLFVS